jgi:2-polyprenyl-3-methyl-5-hydroxy-6-metoxy-1,4-benzoquinol methylase
MKNNLYFRLKGAIRNVVARFGFNKSRVSKETWERQYNSGKWDYLESDKERAHYDVIVDFVIKRLSGGEILDIGCGTGILYKYLNSNNALNNKVYYGVDISENAILHARKNHPEGNFDVANYQTESLNRHYDCAIFNETLYYFESPLQTLQKCVDENLRKGGAIIVSMVRYGHHHQIWDLIDKTYDITDTKTVETEDGVSWTIKVLRPAA